MGQKPRIPSPPPPKGILLPDSAGSPPSTNRDTLKPTFSFKYFQIDHKEHSIRGRQHKEYVHYFEHMASICTKTWGEIKAAPKVFHYHELKPSNSNFTGFKDPQLQDVAAYQFKVSNGGRAVGFYERNNVFNVVFIAPDHDLYGGN